MCCRDGEGQYQASPENSLIKHAPKTHRTQESPLHCDERMIQTCSPVVVVERIPVDVQHGGDSI